MSTEKIVGRRQKPHSPDTHSRIDGTQRHQEFFAPLNILLTSVALLYPLHITSDVSSLFSASYARFMMYLIDSKWVICIQ